MDSESHAYDALRWRLQQSIPTCVRHIAAAGGIRRECSQRTINQSRVPLNHGATTVTSSISTKRWNEARSINDVRGSMVTEVREWACIETYRHHYLVVVVVRCGTRTAQRMRQYPHRLAAKWLGTCASLFTSEHQSPRWRGSDGAIREATSPTRAAQKRHGQPSMCVGASARGRVSPLVQLLQSCGLRSEGDKACATQTPSSSTEQHRAAREEEG